jgi:hypothetical protein
MTIKHYVHCWVVLLAANMNMEGENEGQMAAGAWRYKWEMRHTNPTGIYSPGKLPVVYESIEHVLPTAPSPTATSLT